jgi:hypothetical protein
MLATSDQYPETRFLSSQAKARNRISKRRCYEKPPHRKGSQSGDRKSGEREYLRIDAYSDYMELGAGSIGEETAADQTRLPAASDSRIENTRRLIVRVISAASLPFDREPPAMLTITWMRSWEASSRHSQKAICCR